MLIIDIVIGLLVSAFYYQYRTLTHPLLVSVAIMVVFAMTAAVVFSSALPFLFTSAVFIGLFLSTWLKNK